MGYLWSVVTLVFACCHAGRGGISWWAEGWWATDTMPYNHIRKLCWEHWDPAGLCDGNCRKAVIQIQFFCEIKVLGRTKEWGHTGLDPVKVGLVVQRFTLLKQMQWEGSHNPNQIGCVFCSHSHFSYRAV